MPSCDDIFNLDYEEKTCSCGETKGHYKDSRNAVYSGKHAIPLAIDNVTFAEAIRNQPKEGLGSHFTSIVIPKKCPTFIKQRIRKEAKKNEENMERDGTFTKTI